MKSPERIPECVIIFMSVYSYMEVRGQLTHHQAWGGKYLYQLSIAQSVLLGVVRIKPRTSSMLGKYSATPQSSNDFQKVY